MFRLLKANMEALYRLNWGWNEKSKRNELFDPQARYLVALDVDDNLMGFIHFRFIYDDEDGEQYNLRRQTPLLFNHTLIGDIAPSCPPLSSSGHLSHSPGSDPPCHVMPVLHPRGPPSGPRVYL